MSWQHSDSRHASLINDSAFYRYSTLLAIAALKAFRPFNGSVLMLTDRVCVKLPLAQSPRCYAWRFYIYRDGKNQRRYDGTRWVYRSEKSKTKLLTQLKKMIGEMRELEPAEGMGVGSVDGGTLFDCRLPGASLRFGPFSSVQDFHRHLRDGMDFDLRLDLEVQQLIREHDRDWPIVFTHGDLSSLNILARGDDIVGFVDWETAGWYPS
ncbi:serine/threonine protein kinase [Penicillium mononematosum]|uniref:serine/threonine protein kinase n=1 Tax=Penicillium mononematosum TaxID=268346 RepID=UPI002549A69B|nr:serine/threonine protein kinase [Penicillium mononematosum]KAJ6185178.1 serine/threonine protein kinase [Penicillium mononematosum]